LCNFAVNSDPVQLKRLGAILLLLAFFLQAFTGAAILGNFYINRGSYAQLCINKAKPQLHCNGRCQLMKSLKQQEKQDSQNGVRYTGKGLVLSSKSFFGTVQIFSATSSTTCIHYSPFVPAARAHSFFHPPGMA
jgi:hypothetical protein